MATVWRFQPSVLRVSGDPVDWIGRGGAARLRAVLELDRVNLDRRAGVAVGVGPLARLEPAREGHRLALDEMLGGERRLGVPQPTQALGCASC